VRSLQIARRTRREEGQRDIGKSQGKKRLKKSISQICRHNLKGSYQGGTDRAGGKKENNSDEQAPVDVIEKILAKQRYRMAIKMVWKGKGPNGEERVIKERNSKVGA